MSAYFPATATVHKVRTAAGDLETYSAKIHIYDAQVTKKPVDLYSKIHVKSCSNTEKTVVFFEFSAFPETAAVWRKLDKVHQDFSCTGK